MKSQKAKFFGNSKTLFSSKTIVSIFLIVMLAMFVVANEDEFAEGKQLIDSKVSCDSMTDAQLKSVGEYIMEQMHPGEAHEAMDKMMGLEDNAEKDSQFHINLARNMYCGQGGMMGGNYAPGMMNYRTGGVGMMGPGMMSWESPLSSVWGILTAIFFVGLFLLVWLIVIKLWKEVFGKKR